PRVFLLQGGDEGKLTGLVSDTTVPQTFVRPWDLVSGYRNEIRGVVVFDPAVPATINVATTLAGLEGGVVASPGLAARLEGAPYRLTVLDDLRGRFQSALDAYAWQFHNLWRDTTHRMLIGIPPTRD